MSIMGETLLMSRLNKEPNADQKVLFDHERERTTQVSVYD